MKNGVKQQGSRWGNKPKDDAWKIKGWKQTEPWRKRISSQGSEHPFLFCVFSVGQRWWAQLNVPLPEKVKKYNSKAYNIHYDITYINVIKIIHVCLDITKYMKLLQYFDVAYHPTPPINLPVGQPKSDSRVHPSFPVTPWHLGHPSCPATALPSFPGGTRPLSHPLSLLPTSFFSTVSFHGAQTYSDV